MNGYYEFKVSASANACDSDRGRTTTTTTNMTSSIVEVSAYELMNLGYYLALAL